MRLRRRSCVCGVSMRMSQVKRSQSSMTWRFTVACTSVGAAHFAVGLLEASFGADKAAGMMNRLASSMAGKSFEFLDAAEPGQIVTLLDGELPQTIALVLAHLRPEHASAVLAGFEDTVRTDVARSIATMGSATPEAVSVVAETLETACRCRRRPARPDRNRRGSATAG